MEDYDVIVVGGGIAGSIAAKFTAKNGLKTLLIEKEKTPREKACSGIQFGYFEKIIGEKIPQEKLCNAKITKAHINLPNGFKITAPFKVLNFMRNFFDDWLNDVAQNYGATFWDRTKFLSFKQNESHIRVFLEKTTDEGKTQGIALKTDYLIDATGLRPVIRKKIRPQDFENQTTGATLSY